ncbi:MAG: hypothetical protein IPN69_15385 [Acidobacteria bacterium]|nr:hypothetical protein [Acidobacteriota bacterium]
MAAKTFQLKNPAARSALIAAAVVTVIAVFFCARWFFANTIATRSVYKEIAEISVLLGPSDPQTHFAHAVLLEKTFFPEDLPRSLSEFERAVALSPADFNLWLELGRARARSGDDAGAETALRRAQELAPNYARVAWALGNFLLRQEKNSEAFGLIRRASDADPQYSNPAITNAWQVFDGDYARIRELAGESRNLRASLAAYLARQKRFEEAVEVWNSLPESDRQNDLKANGDEIYREMLAAKRFRDAVGMSNRRFTTGTLFNGDFEIPFTLQSPTVFEWQIADGAEPQIAVDSSQKHDGNLSLILVFNSSDGTGFRGVTQTVATEPGRGYVLRGFYRSDAKAATTLKWTVSNAANGAPIAETAQIDARAEWKEFSVAFKAPADTDAVVISLKRGNCASSICPITGKIWFDGLQVAEASKRNDSK